MANFWDVMSIILYRVPPLLLINNILNLFPLQISNYLNISEAVEFIHQNVTEELKNNEISGGVAAILVFIQFILFSLRFIYVLITEAEYIYTTLQIILMSSICLIPLCIFLLPKDQIICVYRFLNLILIVYVSHFLHSNHIKNLLDPNLDAQSLYDKAIWNFVYQLILGCIFVFLYFGGAHRITDILLLSFLVPSVDMFLPDKKLYFHYINIAVTVQLLSIIAVIWFNRSLISEYITNGYNLAVQHARLYGYAVLIEREFQRLDVITVLKVFWIMRIFGYAVIARYGCYLIYGNSTCIYNENTTWVYIIKDLLTKGCDTQMSIIGFACIVSHICRYIGCLLHKILSTNYDRSIGTTTAVMFLILALQTGLTVLSPELRFIRLCRNLSIIGVSIFHVLHTNTLHPLLISVSASNNSNNHRHYRALGFSAFLLMFSIYLIYFMWSRFDISTWLLSITALSGELIVKIIVSLIMYGLFLTEANSTTMWEEFDDYIFYVKAFGKIIEFIFGVFIFFNGVYILTHESVAAVPIRAIMICLHGYLNIWSEAIEGISLYIKRGTATEKINSMSDATPEQLLDLNNVCSICYQDMITAKITKCKHFFHASCLKKWFHVQDTCPLCHGKL